MAIESMVALFMATAFLVGLAWYASKDRAEDKHRAEDKTDCPQDRK